MNIMFSRFAKKDNSHVINFVIKIGCTSLVASIDIKGLVMTIHIDIEEARRLKKDMSKPAPCSR